MKKVKVEVCRDEWYMPSLVRAGSNPYLPDLYELDEEFVLRYEAAEKEFMKLQRELEDLTIGKRK